ncbi:hypothetical protein ACLB2K_066497 [Fragaria x ananassa]
MTTLQPLNPIILAERRSPRLWTNGAPPRSCLNVDVRALDQRMPAAAAVESQEVIEAEKRVMVGTYNRQPLVIASGKGCKLYDPEGREYLDLMSGIAVNALGHGDRDWIRAVTEQAHVLTHVSNVYYSIPQVELAKRLVACSFADRVFFSNSGTEANEAAIKFSRKFQRFSYPEKKEPATEFISFTNSFHGRTMGSVALTSKEHYRSPFEPLMPGVNFLEYGDVQAARKLIKSGKIAAVFVEPIQGEGGINSATREFLQALRGACDVSGSLLVFDENSGLLIITAGKGNVIRLVPPLIISKPELEQAAEIMSKCLPALDGST